MATSQSQAKVVEIVNKAKQEANTKMKNTDQVTEVMIIQAKNNLAAQQSKNAALIEEGKSEYKNLEAFNEQRRHQYELKKAAVYQDLALKKKNIVMSGKAGEAMLQ